MKVFYSLFAILLSVICILYLVFYPKQETPLFNIYSSRALAKEVTQNEHNSLSEALILSLGQRHHIELSAYNTFYGCINSNNKTSFFIESNSLHTLKINLISDTGKKLSCQKKILKNTCTISPSNPTLSSGRIFLCIMNQSTESCSFWIKIQKSNSIPQSGKSYVPNSNSKKNNYNNTTSNSKSIVTNHNSNKNSTHNKHNSTTSNSKQSIITNSNSNKNSSHNKHNSTTSNSKQSIITNNNFDKNLSRNRNNSTTSNSHKLSTLSIQKPVLYPQFLILEPDSIHKLSIIMDKKTCSLSTFSLISSSPSVATVKSGKIYTHNEGTAIIYMSNKKKSSLTSSCFVRVIKKGK